MDLMIESYINVAILIKIGDIGNGKWNAFQRVNFIFMSYKDFPAQQIAEPVIWFPDLKIALLCGQNRLTVFLLNIGVLFWVSLLIILLILRRGIIFVLNLTIVFISRIFWSIKGVNINIKVELALFILVVCVLDRKLDRLTCKDFLCMDGQSSAVLRNVLNV